ncbi:MAG: PQQ-binding-like beta-propeller repeat protein [Bacteroidales bacterium]|nr:PQQ-binding-like beta-propeller repeat protein [Bacteroidales bacterium]
MKQSSIFILTIALLAFVLPSCEKDPVTPTPNNPDPVVTGDHAELWSYDLGFGSLDDITPAIDQNNNIYFTIVDPTTSEVAVFAIDEDGNEMWKTVLEGQSTGKVIFAENKIFVSTGYPTVIYCFNASNGNIDWDYNLTADYDFFDSPRIAYANNTLYLSSGQMISGFLMAYDIQGNTKWIKEANYGFNLSVSGNALFYHDTDTLYRYNDLGSTCEFVWKVGLPEAEKLKNSRSFNTLEDLPIGADGNLYMRLDAGISIYSPNGELVKTIPLGEDYSMSYSNITLTSSNEIMIGDNDGNLVKFNNNGTREWKTDITGSFVNPYFSSAVTIAENGDFYDAQTFGLYCVKSSGSLGWKVTAENGGGTEHGNLHPPVLNHDGNIISVSSEQSILRCFKGDGKKLASSGWPKPFGNYANTSAH